MAKLGRNRPCWCGSHKKFKKCHYPVTNSITSVDRTAEALDPFYSWSFAQSIAQTPPRDIPDALGKIETDKRAGKQSMAIPIEYYQAPFALFNDELARTGQFNDAPHSVRQNYWGLLPERRYEPEEARVLLKKYLCVLEERIANIVSRNSLASWLHLYRRIFPGSIGEDRDPKTIVWTRMILEAAIQKYGAFEPCDRVALSSEVELSKILGGLLLSPEFEMQRKVIDSGAQLVLTDFGVIELKEFFELEKLAYEVWKTGAQLRTVGKGAPLHVVGGEEMVRDGRSDDLNELLRIFDGRIPSGVNTSTGTVYCEDPGRGGVTLLPSYNAAKVPADKFNEIFRILGFNFLKDGEYTSNFIWYPYNLRDYYHAHKPFASSFYDKHGVRLVSVITVIAAIAFRAFYTWEESHGLQLLHHWQRAYEGPYTREYVIKEIGNFLPASQALLQLDPDEQKQVDIESGARFLELTEQIRPNMDLEYPGPHFIFLPYGKDRVFIDYAWLVRSLYNLFYEVEVSDQNFKGTALEEIVHRGDSELPTKALESHDGSKRQIDAAFRIDDRLIIVECRAVARSIGFDRGDPRAIQYRIEKINKALEDIDEKASWLSLHLVGKNYDLSWCNAIIPLAVSPFVEFIPSLDHYYWLHEELPRVLTPSELRVGLESGVFAAVSQNLVTVRPLVETERL